MSLLDINVEDSSYRELVDSRVELIDLIRKYHYDEMNKDNRNELSNEFKEYLNKYEGITYEIYSRDKEFEEYVRVAKSDKSPYDYFLQYH